MNNFILRVYIKIWGKKMKKKSRKEFYKNNCVSWQLSRMCKNVFVEKCYLSVTQGASD